MTWFLVTKTEIINGCCHFAGIVDSVCCKNAFIAFAIAKRRNPVEGSDFLTVKPGSESTALAARESRDREAVDFAELMDAVLER